MLGLDTIKYNFKDKNFLVFDLETSALPLGLDYNKPWQVAWIICKGYQIIEKHNIYVNWPDLYVSPGAALATRYNPTIVQSQGIDPKQALDKFESYFYDSKYIILGQNIFNFDFYIHNMWRLSYGLPSDYSYINRAIDIRALASAFKLGVKFKENEDFTSQQYRFLSYHKKGFKTNLSQLCKDFNIPFDPELMHDAFEDISKTFEVFKALVKTLEI